MRLIPCSRRDSVRAGLLSADLLSADVFSGQALARWRVWICFLLILSPLHLQDAVASPEESKLELIDFLRGGEQRQAIGTVFVDGESVRLRLFSDQLANYYELTIPTKDFLDAQPIAAEKASKIEEERRTAIASREVQREERRRRRAAERAAARLEREESERGSRRSSGASREGRAKGVERGAKLPQTERALRALSRELDQRFEATQALAVETLARIAERLETSAGSKRKLRDLAVEVEEAQLDLERLAKSLSHRRESLERLEEDSRQGNLKGRQLKEQIEYVADHYQRVAARLLTAEEAVTFTSRLLAAIPHDLPKAEESTMESGGTQDLKIAVSPRISAGGGEQIEVVSGQVSEATFSRDVTTASSGSPRLISAKAQVEESAVRSVASKESISKSEIVSPSQQVVRDEEQRADSTEEITEDSLSGRLPKWPLVVIGLLCFALGRGVRRRT